MVRPATSWRRSSSSPVTLASAKGHPTASQLEGAGLDVAGPEADVGGTTDHTDLPGERGRAGAGVGLDQLDRHGGGQLSERNARPGFDDLLLERIEVAARPPLRRAPWAHADRREGPHCVVDVTNSEPHLPWDEFGWRQPLAGRWADRHLTSLVIRQELVRAGCREGRDRAPRARWERRLPTTRS
jgi:hypothetical protein